MPVTLEAPRLGLEHPRFVGWGRKAWVDGEAILARDRLSGLPVAWRSFPKTAARDWRSFTALAPALAHDLHPELARLIGYGREERSAWIAEEWIPGTTSLAESGSRLTASERRSLLLHFAAALGALHEAGIAHGRLTPAHLQFTRAGGRIGQGWIVGTGTSWLAHPTAPRSSDGVAPEIAAGEAPTPRSDIYELGASWLTATGTEADSQDLSAILAELAHPNPAKRPANGRAVLDLVRGLAPPRARKARPTAASPATEWLAPALVGRASQHQAAIDLIERARRGESHALEVRGSSGSGKTIFLDEAAAAARRHGFAVLALDLRAGCTSDPEQAVITALDRALGRETSIAPPPEAAVALPEHRHQQITLRLAEALDATGIRLCLLIDPGAGSAVEGLPLLRHLASEIGPRPFLVVWSTIEPGSFPLAELIVLEPLNEREQRQLLAPLCAQWDPPVEFWPALERESGGQPLGIQLTLAAWQAAGRLDVDRGRWREAPSDAPATAGDLDAIVTAAIARLRPEAREHAELLALWDGALPPALTAPLGFEQDHRLPDWLAARDARGELVLRSESARAVLLAQMPADHRALGHRRLLSAIGLEPTANAAAFTQQAIGAGELQVAARTALAAARTAQAEGRGLAAVTHYRQALTAARALPDPIDFPAVAHEAVTLAVALGEWSSALAVLSAIDAAGAPARLPIERQFELFLLRSQVLREARRPQEAAAACDSAGRLVAEHSALLEPLAAARVALELAAVDYLAQQPAVGIQRLDRILPQFVAAGRQDLQATALIRRATLESQAGETRIALRTAIATLRTARLLPPESAEIQLRALTNAAFLAYLAGRSAPALRFLAAARALFVRSPHTGLEVTERVHRAEVLAAKGAFAAAEEALLDARRLRLRSAGRSRLPAILITLGNVRARSGRLQAAVLAYEEAIALSEELLLPEVHSARGNLGLLLWRIGERREGERLIRLGLQDARPDRRALGLLNLALCLRESGRLAEAARTIEESIAVLTSRNPAAARRARTEQARLRIAAGDGRSAKAELLALGDPTSDPEARAEEQLTLALAEAALGNDAGPAFAHAVVLAHDASDPTFRAEVMLEALAWANSAPPGGDRDLLVRRWLDELAPAAAATDAPLPRAWLALGSATGRPELRGLPTRALGRQLTALATEGGEDSFAARLRRALEPLGAEAGALILALDWPPPGELATASPAAGESPARAAKPALKPYRLALRDFDRELFRAALERTGNQVPAAARLLRLPESTFRYRAGKVGAWRSRASEPKPDS